MKLEKDRIDEFVNALQLCIRSQISNYHGDDALNLLSIHFGKKPTKDEGWLRFEALAEGEWRDMDPQPMWAYFIKNADGFVTPTLINFLLISRLQKENIQRLAELDSKYHSFAAKILGVRETFFVSESIETLDQALRLIVQILAEQKMTIRELAEKTGLSMVSISNFKTGKDIRLSNFLKIAKALGIQLRLK